MQQMEEEMYESLKKIGMTEMEIKYLNEMEDNNSRISFLRSWRAPLLSEIHSYQQKLDMIDFMIFQLRK